MWTDATDLFWSQTFDQLWARGKTIALGVGRPLGQPFLWKCTADRRSEEGHHFPTDTRTHRYVEAIRFRWRTSQSVWSRCGATCGPPRRGPHLLRATVD